MKPILVLCARILGIIDRLPDAVMQGFDTFIDLSPDKHLHKQPIGRCTDPRLYEKMHLRLNWYPTISRSAYKTCRTVVNIKSNHQHWVCRIIWYSSFVLAQFLQYNRTKSTIPVPKQYHWKHAMEFVLCKTYSDFKRRNVGNKRDGNNYCNQHESCMIM